ncbi:hypothetical protein BDB00DRAFT_808066 [Zychaea mexicana]|uniref:uncharacterized protein n=1 Tax=Zychaea mexicana TaxID=64656 RepID=UPI0022FDEDA6|nr:uncharacterized protein BDB00DRAFT_808066 [Zychaea mexicana]KAI9496621.1 hypothetical protein BDB00DRAFT_808066 [Zychaea mexicana]
MTMQWFSSVWLFGLFLCNAGITLLVSIRSTLRLYISIHVYVCGLGCILPQDQQCKEQRQPLLGHSSSDSVAIRLSNSGRSKAMRSNGNGHLGSLKEGCIQALCLVLWACAISVQSVGGFLVEKIYY